MTMQIAIEAHGNQFVLASDRKSRKSAELKGSDKVLQDEVTYESKIRIAERHNIAVAISGRPLLNCDPAQEFCDYISTINILPRNPCAAIKQWATEYEETHNNGEWWHFTLLMIIPSCEHEPLWTIDLRKKFDEKLNVTPLSFSGLQITGDPTNGAIMWPDYFKCGNTPMPGLEAATNIAALTILTGSELNTAGVRGLEIWRYTDAWRRADRLEINAIGDRFAHLKKEISNFVHAPSNSAKPQT